ncbi:MAG: DUF4342 domain-containing protein [Rhodobacteraceae bacterium]|nr:DUF4342 domain-containing protein [Paracoccaceae bacterium]
MPKEGEAAAKAEGKSSKKDERGWIEEIEVASDKLVSKVKELAAESRVKRIRVLEPDGDIALDIPLTFGAIAGGAVVIAAPVLAVIGALAAFVSKVKIEIVREPDAEDDKDQAKPSA